MNSLKRNMLAQQQVHAVVVLENGLNGSQEVGGVGDDAMSGGVENYRTLLEQEYEWLRIKMQYSQKVFSLTFRYMMSLEGDFDPHRPSQDRQHWQQQQQQPPKGIVMNRPCDVKVTSSLIIVSDSFNRRILCFDLKTKKFKFTLSDSHRPYFMAVDLYDPNSLYVTCMENYVKKFDLEMKAMVWSKFQSDLKRPCGIVVESHQAENARIIVADCVNQSFKIFSKMNGDFIGELQYRLGCKNEIPFGLHLDGDGDLLCTNLLSHTISCISKNTNLLKVYWSIGKVGTFEIVFSHEIIVTFDVENFIDHWCTNSGILNS
nr:unnamed protein product [Naegleria fowleri]